MKTQTNSYLLQLPATIEAYRWQEVVVPGQVPRNWDIATMGNPETLDFILIPKLPSKTSGGKLNHKTFKTAQGMLINFLYQEYTNLYLSSQWLILVKSKLRIS